MGIVKRFSNIVKANVNCLLDRVESPDKMIDQVIRNVESDLTTVRKETASVMVIAKQADRRVESCKAEIDEMNTLAKKAVDSGNDSDARAFLEKKVFLMDQLESLNQAKVAADGNAAKMKEMHAKLSADYEMLASKSTLLKAKSAVARTRAKMSGFILSGEKSYASNVREFERAESKIDEMLDLADASDALEAESGSPVTELKKKYEIKDNRVEVELASLKAACM